MMAKTAVLQLIDIHTIQSKFELNRNVDRFRPMCLYAAQLIGDSKCLCLYNTEYTIQNQKTNKKN